MRKQQVAGMRFGKVLTLTVVGIGIWLIPSPEASAAPVNGAAIAQVVTANSIVDQVQCRVRRVCDWRGCRSVRRCDRPRCRRVRQCDRWGCRTVRRCW